MTHGTLHFLELRIPPPVAAVLIGGAMWLASRPAPSIDLPFLVRGVAFAVVSLVGGATALAGDLAFRHARTTINPFRPQDTSALVTSGVYRYTRNPMYLGLLLVILGWSVFL